MDMVKIAVKNLKKNFGFYALYLFSVAFILTIFFAFVSFSMNDVMMEKISTDGRVETMTSTISVFLMAFVLFYMSYSNRFFLRRRSKELGIYTMLGYRKAKIIKLLTTENILVCGLALLCGILLGGLFHKGIVACITWALGLSIDTASIPLFNQNAIAYAVIFVVAVIIVLLISNIRTVSRTTLIGLVRYNKKAEKGLKTSTIGAIFGLICILGGYALAVDITRGHNSLWYTIGYSPVALLVLCLVSVGTIFFIRSFLPWFWNRAKARGSSFYRPIPIVNIPGFIYRIRTNAKTFIMLAFLMAGTLTVTGALALSLYHPIEAISRIIPSEIEFRADNPAIAEEAAQIANNISEDAELMNTVLVYTTSLSDNLPYEYSIGSQKGDTEFEKILRTPSFECMSETDYLTLLEQHGHGGEVSELFPLNQNECILVKYEPNQDGSTERGAIYVLEADEPITVSVKDTTLLNPIGFANSVATLVVSDDTYSELLGSNLSTTQVISINGIDAADSDIIYQKLYDLLDGSPYLVSASARAAEITHENSSTFLLLAFLVILFFIASGSILFFNNISAVTEAKDEYAILSRIGYSRKLLKKLLSKQIFVCYFIPLVIGLLHSAFAIMCYKTALVQNILGNSLAVYMPVILSYGLTLAIFGIYYLITVRSCRKIVFH